MTSWRWPGVVGLNVFSAIVVRPYRPVVTSIRWPSFEGHDRALGVRLRAEIAAEDLGLALADQRVDALDLDVKQLLDRFLDLRLGRFRGHLEQDLVVLGRQRRLFGDDRGDDHVVMASLDILRHLKRASSASMAALVRTSF
ncbi:hypothetical protein ACVWYH_008093 [Bradyrhizobium sp. GM24.11]